MTNNDIILGKCLSYILRHAAHRDGLDISSDGFVAVDEILRHHSLKQKNCTIDDIRRIVLTNDKQRYTIRNNPLTGVLEICANQGHTVNVPNLKLTPITSKEDLGRNGIVHGTYKTAWEKIKLSGLSRMKRNHIHFAQHRPNDYSLVFPLRRNCQILIYIDIEKAVADGIQFFLSTNNVVLSPGNGEGMIKTEYFSKVLDLASGKSL